MINHAYGVWMHQMRSDMEHLQDWYSDTIWGQRIVCDDTLFEVMSLQIFQAGLTWRMILNKRDGFRSVFDNWSIKTVASLATPEVEVLLNDPGIIRNWQ
mgnify:CR=1 FL=1